MKNMKSSKVLETLEDCCKGLTNKRTMPQKYIPLEAGQIYHIWTHANGAENLFREPENYRFFLEKYTHHVHPVVEMFAYCSMPNHLHLMVRVREEDDLLKFLQEKKQDSNRQGLENMEVLASILVNNLAISLTLTPKLITRNTTEWAVYLVQTFQTSNVKRSIPINTLPD